MTTHAETILGQKSPCGKRLESFTLTHYLGMSALDDGFEAVGFEVVARIRGGLRAGVGSDLDAILFVRAGVMTRAGNFCGTTSTVFFAGCKWAPAL